MYNVACRIVGNEDDATDVLQEAFISAFRNLESYRADATFGAWIKRIVSINPLTRCSAGNLNPSLTMIDGMWQKRTLQWNMVMD